MYIMQSKIGILAMIFVLCFFSAGFTDNNTASILQPDPSTTNYIDITNQNFIPLLYNYGVPIVEIPKIAPYSAGPFTSGIFRNWLGSYGYQQPTIQLYNNTSAFSITMWVQFNKTFSASSGSEVLLLVGNNRYAGTNADYKIIRQTNKYYLVAGSDNVFIGQGLNIGWHFIVITYDPTNTTTKFYIDNSSTVNSTSLNFIVEMKNILVGAETDLNADGSITVINNPAVDFLINQIVFYNYTLTDANIDALASNLTISPNPPSPWQVIAFPQNWANWIGFGDFVINETYNGNPDNCGIYYLAGTLYYSSLITSSGCEEWYQTGYPINTLLDPTFILTHNNYFWTGIKQNLTPITVEAYISAPVSGICQLYDRNGATFPLSPTYFGGATLTLPLLLNGTNDLLTTPILYRPFKILCVEPSNLTLAISFNSNLTDIIYITVPIGCYFNSTTNIDCSIRVDETNKSLYKRPSEGRIKPCQADDTRPECSFVHELTGDSLDAILAALFSYTMIGLYLSIIIATLVAKFTKNAIFGLVIMMICLLIMATIGLLGQWFLYMVIVIAALGVAAIILKIK